MRYYADWQESLSRIGPDGTSEYFNAALQEWVADELIADEIKYTGDWRPIEESRALEISQRTAYFTNRYPVGLIARLTVEGFCECFNKRTGVWVLDRQIRDEIRSMPFRWTRLREADALKAIAS